MSLWQFGAAVEGYNKAQDPKAGAKPKAPSSSEFRAALQRHRG